MPDFVYSPPQTPYLELIYQDDSLTVWNKPAGLLSVPGRLPEHQDSLALRVLRVLPDAKVVHRLDMATSGLLLMPLGKAAQSELSRQFQQRTVEKSYQALVWGELAKPEGEIDLPMRCDWPNRPRQIIDHVQGKSALTRYRLLSYADGISCVALYPETGRSHQLRLHMQALGHPILGDRLYASTEALKASARLCLHAHQLTINHPQTGQRISFEAPVPFCTAKVIGHADRYNLEAPRSKPPQ